MKKFKWVLLLFVSVAAVAQAVEDFIVYEGEARAEIVIAEEPTRISRYAAAELQDYIEKITGVRLPIVTGPSAGRAVIYVGVSPFTEAHGLSTDGLAHGAFRMDSGPGWLALLGPDNDFEPVEPWGHNRSRAEAARVLEETDAITGEQFLNPFAHLYMFYYDDLGIWDFDDRGTLNAVHEFLRDLGVRWYSPGELGEVVPQLATIPLPRGLHEVVAPEFPVRCMTRWSARAGPDLDELRWRIRLGLHYGHDVIGITQRCHGMKFVHGRAETREQHPEYFAVHGGERNVDQKRHGVPCLSSAEIFDKHVAYVRWMFDQYDEPMISIDVVDGFGVSMCECELCAGKGTPERGYNGGVSDYVWGYVNRVAKEIYKTHPDKWVSGMAYGGYVQPPLELEEMSPNLVVGLMSPRMGYDNPEARERFARHVKAWQDKLPSDRFFIHENVTYNRSGRSPTFYTRQSADYLREEGDHLMGHALEIYQHNPSRLDEFDWDSLAVAHLDLYLLSRLWWDRDADVDAMLDEYFANYYGPAAESMQRFVTYAEENRRQVGRDVEGIDRVLELIAVAQADVDPDSIYGQRVAKVAHYVGRMSALREQLGQEREGPLVVLEARPAAAIKIDGRLDDPFWQGIEAVQLSENKSGSRPAVGTTVKMAWGDNDALYVGIRCDEPDMASIVDSADGSLSIFSGDNIDIAIETPIHDFYQLVVGPEGVLFDMDRCRITRSAKHYYAWSSGAQVAVHKGPDYWSVEMQIPAAGEDAWDLDTEQGIAGERPTVGNPWYFNLGRSRPHPVDGLEFSAYAPTLNRHFNDRFLRGRLVVMD